MNRQNDMRDTHVKNIRLNSPLGLLGVPPDHCNAANIPLIKDKGGNDDGG